MTQAKTLFASLLLFSAPNLLCQVKNTDRAHHHLARTQSPQQLGQGFYVRSLLFCITAIITH